MIDIDREHVMTLGQVQDWLEIRIGHHFARSTIYHWVGRGVGGRSLEVIRVGGAIYTTREAVMRFLSPGGNSDDPAFAGGHAAKVADRRAKEVFG